MAFPSGLVSQKEENSADLLMKEGIKLATEMQKIQTKGPSMSSDSGGGRQLERRKTVSKLAENRKSKKITFSLDDNFKQTLEDLDEVGDAGEWGRGPIEKCGHRQDGGRQPGGAGTSRMFFIF